jgi:hypothetical protein
MANTYGVRYKMDNASFGAFMVSEQARRPAIEAAHDVAAIAAANTRASSGGVGDLASNYKVDEHTAPVVIAGNPRVGAAVFNDKRYAAAREFGAGGHTKGKGTRDLRRAGGAVGELRGEPG